MKKLILLFSLFGQSVCVTIERFICSLNNALEDYNDNDYANPSDSLMAVLERWRERNYLDHDVMKELLELAANNYKR